MQFFALTSREVLMETNLSALPLQTLERKELLQRYNLECLKQSSCSKSPSKIPCCWHTTVEVNLCQFLLCHWNMKYVCTLQPDAEFAKIARCCHWNFTKSYGDCFVQSLQIVRCLQRMLETNIQHYFWSLRSFWWQFRPSLLSVNVLVNIT